MLQKALFLNIDIMVEDSVQYKRQPVTVLFVPVIIF